MPAFLVSLLVVVLILVLLQFILEAVALQEPARKIIWVVAIVIGVLWLLGAGFIK